MKALAVVVACAAALFFGILGLGYSSCKVPPKPNCEDAEKTNPNQKYCSSFEGTIKVGITQIGDFIHAYHEETIAIATAIIAIFTTSLGLFTISLSGSTRIAADAAKRAAETADISLKETQRAVVCVRSPMSGVSFDAVGSINGMEFWVVWENGGNTTAKHFHSQISATIIIQPDDFIFGPIGVPDKPSVLGPRAQIESDRIDISMPFISEFFAASQHLFIWGFGEYQDVFDVKKTHYIEFCYKVAFLGNIPPGQCSVRFNICGEHNREYDKKVDAGLSEPP